MTSASLRRSVTSDSSGGAVSDHIVCAPGCPILDFRHSGKSLLGQKICRTTVPPGGRWRWWPPWPRPTELPCPAPGACPTTQQRYLGFLSVMRDAGLPVPDDRGCWYTTEEHRYLPDYGYIERPEPFLEFCLQDCTAVACCDEIADRLTR